MPLSLAPKVAVVIPHFNRSSLLGHTLESLYRQTFTEWEAIVVDDGSSPEEWGAVQKMAGDRVAVLQRTDGIKGPSRCRNIGWRAATAPLIMFLDSDDLMAPWCLEERLKLSRQSPEHKNWVFPVMLFRSEPGDLDMLWNRLEGDDDIRRFLLSDPPWHTSSTLWTRCTLESLGGFDESVMYGDDADLHLRMLLNRTPHLKSHEQLPDVFIRRDQNARITNSTTEQVLDSRLQRLRAGSNVVDESGTLEHQATWQGQYFVECEYLLFNCENSERRQYEVVRAWRTLCRPKFRIFLVVVCYLFIAQKCRTPFYLGLRLARRIAMLMLPDYFFPRGGGFETSKLPEERLIKLRQRLHEFSASMYKFDAGP